MQSSSHLNSLIFHVDRAPIHMDKAVLDSYWNCNSSEKATTMESRSSVSKSESNQSSSSKTTSKASSRKGKECSTQAPQEKEKRALHETPEEKKKRREYHKAKKDHTEKKKSRKEVESSETPEEKKKRREERKEKKQKKERKEKGSKTKSMPAATENMSCESPGGRSSQTASTITRNGFGGVVGRRGHVSSPRKAILSCQVSMSKCQDVYAASNSITKDSSVLADKSCFSSEEMRVKAHDEVNLLQHNVKTLSCQLKMAKETISQLDDRNLHMSNLGVKLVKTEEQLEYVTEENKEYSSRVHALEQALILQENELDNALALIRQNAKQGHDFLETGKTTNHFASEDVDERFPIRKMLIASEKVKEQFLIRKQLKAVRGELEQAQQERDMAVDKATAASIQLTESQALVEQMRALMWQQDPATNSKGVIKRDFLWSKDDDNLGISFYDDDCTDATEDNTSVSSEDLHGSGKDMDYNPRRRREEAYWNQPL